MPSGNPRNNNIQEELRQIQRNMQSLEREYAEQSQLARTSSDDLVQKFKEVMEPETDYDTDALMFSETESESSSSGSDFLTDNSQSSFDAEDDFTTETKDIPKNKKKKNKVMIFRINKISDLYKSNKQSLSFFFLTFRKKRLMIVRTMLNYNTEWINYIPRSQTSLKVK